MYGYRGESTHLPPPLVCSPMQPMHQQGCFVDHLVPQQGPAVPPSGSQGSICPYPGVLAQEAWDGAINLAHPDTPHAVLLCWNRGDSNSYPHMSSSRSRRLVLPGLSRLRSWRRVARRSPLAVRYSGTRALVALPSMAWSSYSPGLPLKVLQSRGAYPGAAGEARNQHRADIIPMALS